MARNVSPEGCPYLARSEQEAIGLKTAIVGCPIGPCPYAVRAINGKTRRIGKDFLRAPTAACKREFMNDKDRD